MSTIQATDTLLVQRGTTQYSTAADLSKAQDTDLLLINRAGVDYQCSYLDWKASQGHAPVIGSLTLADSPQAGRFTSGSFAATATLTDDGAPAAVKSMKAWVQGTLKVSYATDAITTAHAASAMSLVQNSGFALYGDNPYAGEARKQGSAPFVGLMSVIPGKEELYWQWDGRPFTAIIDGEIVFELAGMRVDAPSPQTFYQAGNQLTASWTRFSSKGMYGVQIFGPLITRASQLPDISSFQAGCGDAGIAVHVHRIGKRIKNPDGTTTDVWLSQTSGTGKGRYEVTFAGPTNLSSIPSGSAFTAPHGLHGTYLNRIGTTNSAALMLDGGGPPVAGDVLAVAGVPVANAKLYLKFDAAGAVSDLSSADPGWVAMSGASPYHLTFPATLPSGHAPDVDLPAGTTITAELQAANARGTVVATSNTVTPA